MTPTVKLDMQLKNRIIEKSIFPLFFLEGGGGGGDDVHTVRVL